MLTFRLRVGPKAPQCLGQSTTVTSAFDPSDTVASLDVPTVTYDEPSGKRATKTMYLIASNFTFPSRVKVVTTVGANKIEQSFALNDNGNGCGAIVTCRQKCVTECDQCATGASATAQTALDAVDQCLAMYCSTDGGATDAGSACRDAALQDSSQCLTASNTCQTAR